MSILRTVNAKRAVRRMNQVGPNTLRDYSLSLTQAKINQSLPPKEIVRQLRRLRLTRN